MKLLGLFDILPLSDHIARHIVTAAFNIKKHYLTIVKVRIHGAILRAMAKLHRVSTPKIVARNIAAVEFCSTSATLRATNFFVYPPSAEFRAIL